MEVLTQPDGEEAPCFCCGRVRQKLALLAHLPKFAERPFLRQIEKSRGAAHASLLRWHLSPFQLLCSGESRS